jgi:hypothetical protein
MDDSATAMDLPSDYPPCSASHGYVVAAIEAAVIWRWASLTRRIGPFFLWSSAVLIAVLDEPLEASIMKMPFRARVFLIQYNEAGWNARAVQ